MTLLLLVFVAVPMKRIGGDPRLVQLLGPVHGFAFLLYIYQLLWMRGQGLIETRQLIGWTLVSFVPFGSFLVLPRVPSKL